MAVPLIPLALLLLLSLAVAVVILLGARRRRRSAFNPSEQEHLERKLRP